MITAADPVARIAQAVLYEGYLLWPYRRSALKNRQRWTFGGVFPETYSRARGEDDPWRMTVECLVEADERARLDVRVRFLHVVDRQVMDERGGERVAVDQLAVSGRRHLTWEEATEREIVATGLELAALGAGHSVPIEIAAGELEEPIEEAGARVAALVRSWRRILGTLTVRADEAEPGVWRVHVEVVNTTPWTGGPRELALRHALVSTHAVLRIEGGAFVSPIDPPPELRAASAACRSIGSWPALVGEPGERHTLLAAPIILGDYPRIAPESPGDLFDGGEIDQLLILNVLALTDDERREMADSDPRAREILERCAALAPDEMRRLHGAVREFRVLGAE
ncbi:MAG TPA: hypothetical protein VFW66_03100 [Gemmatimonadales bacterium]|nr:hypothetical protein [Gemmatimonadales bacterium]